jgi:FAD/FMN-containing dehydrogenase
LKTIGGWGNYPRIKAEIHSAGNLSQVIDHIKNKSNIIARGNGRSYGDAALSDTILSTLHLSRITRFDGDAGILTAEAGVLLKNILDLIVPQGYFLPVTPGTQYITLGGAIAADVHGKNHSLAGSFSNHVLEFDLVDDTGTLITCSPHRNTSLFWNTCGGMGLTGIIVKATIQLIKIESCFLKINQTSFVGLETLLDHFQANSKKGYSVAWIDALAQGKNKIRSVHTLGQHLNLTDLPDSLTPNALLLKNTPTFEIPFTCPSFTLNKTFLKFFNHHYLVKNSRAQANQIVHFNSFFFSLDTIGSWYRLYGRKGFLQYQFVLPPDQCIRGFAKIFQKIRSHSEAVFLAVLKRLGPTDPNSIMSFPMPGFTLALDFKFSHKTLDLLNDLDEIVLEYGGRVYLAKDARMEAKIFKASYPKIVTRNNYFRSKLSDRLEI